MNELQSTIDDIDQTTQARLEDHTECPFEVGSDHRKAVMSVLTRAIVRELVVRAVERALAK